MASGESSASDNYYISLLHILIIGVFTFVFLLITKQVVKHRRYRKHFINIPGMSNFHWIFGNVLEFPGPGESGVRYMINETHKFPRFKKFWYSSLMCRISLHHPDLVRQLLKSSEPKPRTFGTIYRAGKDWLGEGLLISNGKKWSRNRRLLTPAFHFDVLRQYIYVKNEAVDVLVDKIDKCVANRRSFELFEFFGLCTLDVLLRCAFSYVGDIQTLGEKHAYIKAVTELVDGWVKRILNPLLFPDFIFYLSSEGRKFARNCKYVHEFAEELISKRKQELEEKTSDVDDNRKYTDFLDILLSARDEDGKGLSDQDIRNEADTFLFEGHDTTTSALSWTLYSLATHPECQKKIQSELDEIYAGKDSENITMNDLQKMEYMTMCLKEGLRLHPPVLYIQRILTQEFEFDGHTIPPGTIIGAHIFNVHHNETVWEDPNEFRPERFTADNVQDRHPFAFVPFSAGSRNCIGQNFAMHEMKILLARILRKYSITVDRSVPVLRKIGAVLRSENGIHVFATPRN